MRGKLSEYIKHCRHFDGIGMGDQDLESRAKELENRIEELNGEVIRLDGIRRRLELDAEHYQIKSNTLKAENEALRNPWISVDERLPDAGRAVLIAHSYQNGSRAITRGFYAPNRTLDADHWEELDAADYDEETDRYYCPEGWHEQITSEYCDLFYGLDRVTHWQPLPLPPEPSEAEHE